MQVPGDPASLLILSCDETARKAPQFVIQRFQLTRLAMQIHKYANLCPQQFRNDRDGNIVHGAAFVSLEVVHVCQQYRGDEDDRRLLKARMLADYFSEFKTVEFWHAHI